MDPLPQTSCGTDSWSSSIISKSEGASVSDDGESSMDTTRLLAGVFQPKNGRSGEGATEHHRWTKSRQFGNVIASHRARFSMSLGLSVHPDYTPMRTQAGPAPLRPSPTIGGRTHWYAPTQMDQLCGGRTRGSVPNQTDVRHPAGGDVSVSLHRADGNPIPAPLHPHPNPLPSRERGKAPYRTSLA